MKYIIALVSLFTLMSVHAADISAKSLIEIESRIALQRDTLHEKLIQADTDDITEGKIIAALGNMIEDKLDEAEAKLNAIQTDDDLTVENIQEIEKLLETSEQLINEI